MNQDYIYCNEHAIGCLPNLFIVADGMGGHKAGDLASKMCVEAVCDSVRDSELTTPVSVLNEAVFKAHHSVQTIAADNPDYEGMGTTLVVATILDNILYVANIGDSRLYLLRETLNQITEDHSLVEEMVKSGELAKENVRSHPNKNVITRALGVGSEIKPDYFEVKLHREDVILMCTDGLSNMIEDAEIEYIIKGNSDNVEKAGRELLDQANDSGGKDNITVLLVKV